MTYPPASFASRDLGEAVEIAGAIRFASIFPLRGEVCEVVFAPFTAVGETAAPCFLGHLLRSNPLHALTADGPLDIRLVFHAADGYVSPSVYAEKPRTGRVVPTWNYVAVQFEGLLEAVPDDALMALLERQVADFERAAGSDWRLHDAPADYLEQMARAIFGVRFTPRQWHLHKKLSQNRPQAAQAIHDWFAAHHGERRSIADWMVAEFDSDTVSEPVDGD